MTTFYTASRSPTTGNSARCKFCKGVPIGWGSSTRVVGISRLFGNIVKVVVPLGDWKYEECVCQIDCENVGDVDVDTPAPAAGDPPYSNWLKLPAKKICPSMEDLVFTARVNSPSSTSPTDFLLTFTDAFGNTRKLTVSVMLWLVPKVPTTSLESIPDPGTQFEPGRRGDAKRVKVTVPFKSSDDTDISGKATHYQLQRYVNHDGVVTLLRDWTTDASAESPDNSVLDFMVQAEKEYGYRVRYKANTGETTLWSAWTVVNT